MKIQTLQIIPYQIPLTNGQIRAGATLEITDEKGNQGCGDIAPLPRWSSETLEAAVEQYIFQKDTIINIPWSAENCFQNLAQLQLLPSLSFGLESALLTLLSPVQTNSVATSALLMGSPQEILKQAQLRCQEGYQSAKLKVNNLTFTEAADLIHQLKNTFSLRIDVNCAWSTSDSLHFFEQFPFNTFDYVEEPFQNPHDLTQFLHPLAIDESFPSHLSLQQLETFPTLKALIYKPTIQGGMLRALPLHQWTSKRGIQLILSSSFESSLGLAHIASMAHRLNIQEPIGIGTHHYFID